MSSTRFVDWNVFLDEYDNERRDKTEHYLAAIRHDLHGIAALIRSAAGEKGVESPRLKDMYLGSEGDDDAPIKPPEGHGYDCEGDKGDFDKGYALPGIDTDSDEPLSEEWAKVTAQEKAMWAACFGASIIDYQPGKLDQQEGTPTWLANLADNS